MSPWSSGVPPGFHWGGCARTFRTHLCMETSGCADIFAQRGLSLRAARPRPTANSERSTHRKSNARLPITPRVLMRALHKFLFQGSTVPFPGIESTKEEFVNATGAAVHANPRPSFHSAHSCILSLVPDRSGPPEQHKHTADVHLAPHRDAVPAVLKPHDPLALEHDRREESNKGQARKRTRTACSPSIAHCHSTAPQGSTQLHFIWSAYALRLLWKIEKYNADYWNGPTVLQRVRSSCSPRTLRPWRFFEIARLSALHPLLSRQKSPSCIRIFPVRAVLFPFLGTGDTIFPRSFRRYSYRRG